MKRHLIITLLGSLTLSASLAFAQDAAAPAAEPAETPAEAVAQPAAEAPPETLPAATEVVAVEGAVAIENGAMPAVEVAATENAVAVETDVTSPAADEAIDIVIDDTPLLDAIRNLARQASINLIIDPKVGFGQTDGSGKAMPQPNVTIRWENITAAQALGALLNNYGLQAVEDPKVQITRITVKDPAAPDPLVTETIQLQYASPSNVLVAVTAAFTDKRSKVVADTRTSQLVVVTTDKEMVEVKKLVNQLDTPTKQVLIEARLVETQMNPTTIKGVNWQSSLGGGQGEGTTVRFGNNGNADGTLNAPGVTMNDLAGSFAFNPAAAFLNSDGLSATLSFLNTRSAAKILASPRTVTLDNETAVIEAGTLYPIVNVTAGTANSTGGSQVNYSNLTVRLDVTPRISANNLINLKVSPTVMRLQEEKPIVAGSAADGSPSIFTVPVFAKRSIDTRVMIPSGNTLVMGGLIQDSVKEGNIKVPLLGDIPFLGRLFRQDSKEREKGNLIVFITPTIVQDEDFQPTKSTYLQTPVSTADVIDDEWSAWDTGKPHDWTKPSE